MAYYVKKNGQLEKIAGNVSISQADWNETDDRKFTKIKNQPETLKTLDAVAENSNENALVGANALKELTTTVAGMGSELIKTSAKVNLLANSDLGINVVEKGENIHLNDSSDNKLVEFGLYGKAMQNKTTGKNLLAYPYNSNGTHTINGITFTVLEDGRVKAVGTATTVASLSISGRTLGETNDFILPNGKYILSGCPKGGSTSSYYINFGITKNEAYSHIGTDSGNGYEFTASGDDYSADNVNLGISLCIASGKTVDLIFEPMIRLASITDDTYEPYTGGQPSPSPEYPQDIVVSGESHNLLPYPYTEATHTDNGITWTVNEDGTVIANGTATARSSFVLKNSASGGVVLEKGDYIFSGCPSGGSTSTYAININSVNNNTVVSTIAKDVGSGVTFTVNDTFSGIASEIVIVSGTKVKNLVFYPMIRKTSVKNNRYMPYGKGSVEVKSVGKNLITYPYQESSVTREGVVFTDNGDGTITANGAGTGTGTSNYYMRTNMENAVPLLKGTYILSLDGMTGQSAKTYALRARLTDDNGKTYYAGHDADEGGRIINVTKDNTKAAIYIFVASGYTVNNLTFKPMLRKCDENGNPIGDDTYEPYKETLATIPTENGLAGIPVDSGGNYTDSNGQQWICDEIVRYSNGSGEYVKRVGKYTLPSDSYYRIKTGQNVENYFERLISFIPASGAVKMITSVSSHFASGNPYNQAGQLLSIWKYSSCDIRFRIDGISTVEELTTWLADNKVNILYELPEVVTTPLTAEQLAEIEKLSTFYPVTNISNDFDCGMKVKYIADNKAYVDKNLELQMKAQEQAMMSMFLLLPDEMQAAMINKDINNILLESEE